MSTKDLDDFFMTDSVPEPEPVREKLPPPPEPSPARPVEPPKARSNSGSTLPNLTGFDIGLPANVDAERTILGAVLLDNAFLKEISLTIEPDDFSLDSHKRICLRMKELYEAGTSIDIITLSNALAHHKEVELVGGIAYLASLTEGLPRRPVINEYIRIVKDKSLLRDLMTLCSQTITRAGDQSDTALEVHSALEISLKHFEDKVRSLRRTSDTPFFVGFRTFVSAYPDVIDWTVEDLIQKDGNGLILGDPGTSKSLAVFDLALHLVAGVSWFHHKIPQRMKVGLVTREDAPGLSQSRLTRLREGASEALDMFLAGQDLENWLYVHTRAQRETWTLQSEQDIQEIIEAIKERGIQICFFDVFRVLWHGNENDSRETAIVLEAANRIGREAKCQVGLVHHVSKSDRGTIFDRARGSGITGWRQWAIGLTIENPDADPRDQIRKMEFQSKAGCASSPIYYRIDGYERKLKLEEVDPPAASDFSFGFGKKKKKDSPPQSSIPYSDK